MPHPSEHTSTEKPLGLAEAEQLAESMRMFGSSSRLRLLWVLLEGPLAVDELSEKAGLSQSATSHQLRLLRQAKLVRAKRDGRHAFYELHDHHLPELLAALRHHREHVDLAYEQPDSSIPVTESA